MRLRILISSLCLSLLLSCNNNNQAPARESSSKQTAAEAGHDLELSSAQRDKLKQSYAVTPFKVLSIAELSFDSSPAIAVTFASPLDPTANWRDHLHINLKDGSSPEGDWILGNSFTTVYFPFIEAQAHYKIEVKTGILSLTGRQLQKPFTKTLTTRNKQQSVKFVSYGTQLSPTMAEGLTVEAINIEAVDVDFFKIRTSQLSAFFARSMTGDLHQLQNIKQYGDLAYSARFDLDHAENKRQKSIIPISQLNPLQQPGVYFAVMREAGHYDYQYQSTWFTLGDIGLQVRQFDQQIVAFTHHAISTKPVKNVSVTLFDKNAKVLATGQTLADGLAKFSKLNTKPYFAIAKRDDHYSALKLRNPAMDLSEYRLPSRSQRPLELFIYSPRNLYRPGETVHINGLLRDNDARLAGSPPIKANIKTPDGRVYQSIQWNGDAQAFYTHTLKLPKDAARGQWQLQATLGNGDLFKYVFNVEDFLPERMKLQLQAPAGTHIGLKTSAKSNITIDIQGDYLYGAPAAGNRVEATVQATAARGLFDNWEGFVFGTEDYSDYNTTTELPANQLDDQGYAALAIPNEWLGTKQPLKIVTRVSLFETGGRPVSRSITQYLWPRDNLIGIRPTWKAKYTTPNTSALLELIQVNKKGEQTAAKQVDVLVLRESNQYYWEWNNHWQYNRNNQATPVYNRVVDLPADERTPIAVPVEYGHYRVEIRNKQQELLASYRFYSGWSWNKPANGETGRPDKIAASWDANAYSANTTATLGFEAPYEGTALITMEADQLLWHQTLEVKAGPNTVAIPIDEAWNRHDIYATINLLRKGQGPHKNIPKRAFGLIHLPLDRSLQNLQLSLEAPQKTLPEARVVAKIKVQNPTNEPVFLTLSAVDSGVLSLSNFKTPKPYEWFFEPRAYGTELRDTWASFIEQLSDIRARQRFGGDAEDQLAHGGEAPQTDVQVVQLYSGKVAVGVNGDVEVPLELPYFNGELRLMALAWSANSYGHLEAKIKVAAPIVAEVSTPRFLAFKDQANATFDVQNLTDIVQTLDVKAAASKAIGGKQLLTNIRLEPQQKHTLQLPITAQQSSGAGEVQLDITNNTNSLVQGTSSNKTNAQENLNLTRSWKIGLRPAYPAINIQTQQAVVAGATFKAPSYNKPPFEIPQQQMHLSLSPQPPLNLSEHLNQLISYPYGCLEQTTSRLWPLLVSTQAEMARYLGKAYSPPKHNKQPNLLTQRAEVVGAAIGRISGMERGDGSFGLWSNQSNEAHWLTAYATEALITAKQQGYAVDDAMLARSLKRLKTYVTTQGKLWSESQHYSSWPNHYHIAYRAYAALVLARRQQITLSELRNLYDNHASMAKTQLPMAQLALALELTGDVRRAEQAWKKALAKAPRANGYAGDYGTPVRDLAWVSTLALQSNLVKDPMQNLMQLRDELTTYRWLSTQDRWALFNLGHTLAANALPEWQLALSINPPVQNPKPPNQPTEEPEQTNKTLTAPYSKMWQGPQVPNSFSIQNTNSKTLFVNLQYSGYPLEAPKPISDGISVLRTFYNLKGEPVTPKSITTGNLILVRLDITSDKRVPDALVVDLLPAGFELENQNLAAAVKMHDIRVQKKSVTEWLKNSKIFHEEYRDDRYVAAIGLSHRASQVFYLVRAVTPGTYTVPPTLVEDMYRPWLRAIGRSEGRVTILPK